MLHYHGNQDCSWQVIRILQEIIITMAKPHSQRERREQILLLMSKGLSQQDIATELHTTRQTISRDMRAINIYTNDNLINLARETLSKMYQSCITGINEILKECWQIYDMGNDSGLTWLAEDWPHYD